MKTSSLMIPPFRYILSSLALGSLCILLSLTLRAAGTNVDPRVSRLDQLVALTPEQKVAIAQIFHTEDQTLAAIPAGDRPAKGAETRQNTRQQIRALLSSAQ